MGMKKEDIVKKVAEILDVKYSHFDDHMNTKDYFGTYFELEHNVRIVCYPGMCPWSFAILENMDVITPLSNFADTLIQIFDESDPNLDPKHKEMIVGMKTERDKLKNAKEYLINNNCQEIINESNICERR